MVTSDERLKVLQMLEDGKISAEDAATLLRALEGGRKSAPGGRAEDNSAGPGRHIRIHVSDLDTGETKVNVTLPFKMVSAGFHIAESFAPDFGGLDIEELEGMVSGGSVGKIIEVYDAEDRERVEVYVE